MAIGNIYRVGPNISVYRIRRIQMTSQTQNQFYHSNSDWGGNMSGGKKGFAAHDGQRGRFSYDGHGNKIPSIDGISTQIFDM